MDTLITTAWRAFWVGLGASAVLIAQTLMTPPTNTATGRDVKQVAPQPAQAESNQASAFAPRTSLTAHAARGRKSTS